MRRYLLDHNMNIIDEDMVEEDGKYYPMMRVIHGESPRYAECEYIFGKRLLEKKNPVLEKFLHRELEIREGIFKELSHHVASQGAKERMEEIRREIMIISRALGYYCIHPEV